MNAYDIKSLACKQSVNTLPGVSWFSFTLSVSVAFSWLNQLWIGFCSFYLNDDGFPLYTILVYDCGPHNQGERDNDNEMCFIICIKWLWCIQCRDIFFSLSQLHLTRNVFRSVFIMLCVFCVLIFFHSTNNFARRIFSCLVFTEREQKKRNVYKNAAPVFVLFNSYLNCF